MEDKIATLKYLIEESKRINVWRKETMTTLLCLAPLMPDDYYLMKHFVLILGELNEPFQPCMNWIDKNIEEEIGWIATKVKVEMLLKKLKELKIM